MDSPALHAVYAPSASSRWLTCTASACIDVSHIENRASSFAADLGTALHMASELAFSKKFTPLQLVGQLINGVKIERLHVKDIIIPYIKWVESQYDKSYDELHIEVAAVLIKDKCYGTADIVIIEHLGEGKIRIKVIDLKTGSGYKVIAVENSQLQIYAAGVYRHYSLLYDVVDVVAGICQPPFDTYTMVRLNIKELEKFAAQVEVTINKIEKGDVEYAPSEMNCKYCPAITICPAVNQIAIEAAKIDFKDVKKTAAKRLSEQRKMIPVLKDFCKAVEDEIKTRVLGGKRVPHVKVVEGRRSRRWKGKKEETVVNQLNKLGIPKTWTHVPGALRSPHQLEELLREKGKDINVSKLIETIPGVPTIADETDSRPAVDSSQSAKHDFADVPTRKSKTPKKKKPRSKLVKK